jgi:hypothetical protein
MLWITHALGHNLVNVDMLHNLTGQHKLNMLQYTKQEEINYESYYKCKDCH